MESAGHKSTTPAGGRDGACSGGHLCHLCGYKYASAHPSAKQRRAHKKNCGAGGGGGGKSPPAADTADAEEERQGKKLLLDECEGEAGGGEGNGAGASDSGGGLPGSAQDVGNAVVEDGDNGVHSPPDSSGAQVTIDDITSEVALKANGTEIQSTQVAMQLSENALHAEDLHPSESHVSGDHSQDASASHHQSEPEEGARFSPDLSADEISKPNGVSLAPDAASNEISATVGCPDDVVVTENDCTISNTEEDKASEDMLAKGSEIVEGQSATTVEKDNTLDVVSIERIPSEETESKEESGVIGTNLVEQTLGYKELPTDKQVGANGTSGDDLSELDSGGCHLEAADVVKMQQQTDTTSVVAEQITNSKQTDLEEGQSYPDADVVIQDAGTATRAADSTGDLTKKEPSEVTMEDVIQIDLVEPSSEPHEVNMVSSKEDFDKNRPNENISAVLTFPDRTEALSVDTEGATSHATKAVCSTDDIEEIKRIEQITAEASPPESSVLESTTNVEEALSVDTEGATSHESKAVCNTDNIEEIKQIEQITAEASPPESSVLESTSNVEEKEQIEEVIADTASYKVDVISSRDIVVEKEQRDVYVGTAQEINVVDIPANVELKKHNEESTRDPSACETNMTNITDNVEERKQNEVTTTDQALHAINVIHSPGNDDKIQNEDMSEVPSSQENADNVKEKDEDSTSYNIDTPSAVNVVEVKKQEEEVTAEPTCPEVNVVHSVDNVKEKESEEPAASREIDAGSNADSILVVHPSSHENSTPEGTDDAEEKNQKEKVAADHAGDKIPAAQSTDDTAEKKNKDETAAAEIKTTESANGDQNEEITDKEMTIDSDKSHVSLKSLLSEKGMETTTKEKKAPSTKDRVLSFRRRSSKDNPSPGKPGSVEQDWNSPARLPVEKSPKGKKQPWMPFICCHSMSMN
uniref:Uncharacterized protein n=1 Tax=Avena sativa TaxID=4498 RepID=A0ACD6ALV7_AVESA